MRPRCRAHQPVASSPTVLLQEEESARFSEGSAARARHSESSRRCRTERSGRTAHCSQLLASAPPRAACAPRAPRATRMRRAPTFRVGSFAVPRAHSNPRGLNCARASEIQSE